MTDFKVGDKVKCINIKGTYGDMDRLVLNKIYTIDSIDRNILHFVEIPRRESAWFAYRFELVSPKEDEAKKYLMAELKLLLTRHCTGEFNDGRIAGLTRMLKTVYNTEMKISTVTQVDFYNITTGTIENV